MCYSFLGEKEKTKDEKGEKLEIKEGKQNGGEEEEIEEELKDIQLLSSRHLPDLNPYQPNGSMSH